MASKVAMKIGQVWRDGDKRMKGRTVTVLGFSGSVDRWDGHDYKHDEYVNVQTSAGRTTRIRLDRFDGKQYVLVERADA